MESNPKELSSVEYCQRCLYPASQPLGIVLDEQGICSGCRVHEEKDTLDWNERWNRLETLVYPYRSKDKRNYDCIVPVSGAGDSYFILHLVKNRLKLNPLLVTYNKYWNTPLGIRNLANLRVRFNCDILVQNVNPNSVRKIVKNSLRKMGSIYWHCIAGQTAFPVQTAVRYKIPLIIWGAHQGMEQTGMFSHLHEVEMTRRYRRDHDLMGVEADDLLSDFDILSESDIWQYRYPADDELNEVGVRGIYLNNYVRWDPKKQHEQMIELYGYKTARFSRTFDCYDHVDCYNYMGLHDQIKLYKHGYSKVLDHASREIRHGRITRNQGFALAQHYAHQPPIHNQLFYEWLGVEESGLKFVLDMHRNPSIWKRVYGSDWCFLPSTHEGSGTNDPNKPDYRPDNVGFHADGTVCMDEPSGYITIGKGLVLS